MERIDSSAPAPGGGENPGRAFFARIRQNPDFVFCYANAMRFMCKVREPEEILEMRDALAGYVFEIAAFERALEVFAPEIANGARLLTSNESVDYYIECHPKKAGVVTNMLGHRSLDGISVFDGLLVRDDTDPPEVLAFWETTLVELLDRLDEKCRAFEMDTRRLPNVTEKPKPRLVFGLPRGDGLSDGAHEVSLHGRKTTFEVVQTAFNRGEFAGYIDYLFGAFREDKDFATLDEIQQWIREQQARDGGALLIRTP